MAAFVAPIIGSIAGASRDMELLRGDRINFERLAVLLKKLTGIYLAPTEKNLSLMAARLAPILRETGGTGYQALATRLETGAPDLVREFISAMTTNTTEFFREAKHFAVMVDELKRVAARKIVLGDRSLRVWCAAVSSGQEIYSTLMTIHEQLPELVSWNIKVLASDIDHAVLAKAAAGRYSEADVHGVPPLLRQKYFDAAPAHDGKSYQVTQTLRKFVTFAPFNLMQKSYPFKHPFDVIFCRNVMIYFERNAAAAVARQLFGCLATGGVLFLGHSETGLLKGPDVESPATAAYRRGKA